MSDGRAPLPSITRQLVDLCERGRSVRRALARLAPDLVTQMRADARRPELLALWGESRNHDENAGARIVHPGVLAAIGDLLGVDLRGEVVHAGAMHTYGYLLSNLRTPYGYKRSRWVEPGIERGLGIRGPALRPYPRAGTLLANATYLFGKLVFRAGSRERRVVDAHAGCVAPELVDYDAEALRREQIVEVVESVDGAPRRPLELRTDLVQLPRPRPGGALALLVYWVSRPSRGRSQLLTAFAVDAAGVARARKALRGQPALRYNAHVRGLAGRRLGGRAERRGAGRV